MLVLGLSDEIDPLIYSPRLRILFSQVDLVIGCGDLPTHYLDFVVCQLDKPLYFVEGNHVSLDEEGNYHPGQEMHGGFDLHCRLARCNHYLLAGVAGSLRYSHGPFQYTQAEMWLNVIRLFPGLLRNKIFFGRSLDLFISHAPPWGIHDQPDLTHRGIKAFRWFDQVFQPLIHLHGHIHYYRPDTVIETLFGKTRVINTYRFKKIELPPVNYVNRRK
jgi:Icc-related predicted phosphoesterase